MASVTTSEFARVRSSADPPPFSMIEQKGLLARLAEEIVRAADDLASDPRGFFRSLLSGEKKDARRRRLIYTGLSFALLAHVAFAGFIIIASRYQPARQIASKPEITWLGEPTGFRKPSEIADPSKPESPRGGDGGGGAGGGNTNRPATKGETPQALPQPQIVKPTAPTLPNPALPMPPTIVGAATAPPPPGAVLGVPNGPIAEAPSPGMGQGDGLGDKSGSGVGSSGEGPGVDRGRGGHRGGGGAGKTDGSGPMVIAWNFPQKPSGYVPFSWIYRPTPTVTPEAQANKVSGIVLLRATFGSDGAITDIEIVNRVPYMTESAVEALRRSRFRPATVNGVPVTLTKVPVRIDVHY